MHLIILWVSFIIICGIVHHLIIVTIIIYVHYVCTFVRTVYMHICTCISIVSLCICIVFVWNILSQGDSLHVINYGSVTSKQMCCAAQRRAEHWPLQPSHLNKIILLPTFQSRTRWTQTQLKVILTVSCTNWHMRKKAALIDFMYACKCIFTFMYSKRCTQPCVLIVCNEPMNILQANEPMNILQAIRMYLILLLKQGKKEQHCRAFLKNPIAPRKAYNFYSQSNLSIGVTHRPRNICTCREVSGTNWQVWRIVGTCLFEVYDNFWRFCTEEKVKSMKCSWTPHLRKMTNFAAVQILTE